jgi:serine/threonine-protein kinase
VEDAIQIACEVADALGSAHSRGVVHRDIKPENVLLGEGHAVVADFGIARAISAAGVERLTETGIAVGTPAYMSPEQATGEGELDGRSDIYSLGCVLYEMLAGDPPFAASTGQAILARKVTESPPRLSVVRDTVTRAVEQATMRALARVPADRFASAVAFAEALTKPAAGRSAPQSIAVLPLLNLSTDPENEYFADVITEDVTAQLSKIRALKVISRTSVMRYKGREESLKAIGATLGVGTILEGSVRRAGNRVRIVAQLIDAETDEHLWAETYDRELTDIFAIQSDVAMQIAAALETELTADEQARIEKEPTRDLDAYQLYLKGRHCFSRFTHEGFSQGVEYFQQAIDRDPDYALAYANMAVCYIALGMGHGAGTLKPGDAYPKANAAAAKALQLDSELGEAHASLGFTKCVYDFDWEGAERTFSRALELNPNAADTHDMYGLLLAAQERYDEALAAQRRSQELDPLTAWHSSDLASTLLRAGRYDEAQREAKRVLELQPHFPFGHATLGWAYLKKGMNDEGLTELEKAVALSPENTIFLAQLGQGYAIAGRVEDARAILHQLEELSHERYVAPYHMAYVHAGLGEDDKALDALERAYEERAGGIYGIKGSFLFSTLRSLPRFKALLSKMNLD